MKKFRDMVDSEKLEIISAMLAGEIVEFTGNGDTWAQSSGWGFCLNWGYRIPKRPMSIDWSVLKDAYICAVKDKNGLGITYTSRPELRQSGWLSVGYSASLTQLKSYDPGTVDWTESLIWRPGHEQD